MQCFLTKLLCLTLFFMSTPALAETFKIGIVPQFDARKIQKIWGPVIANLESRTGYDLEFIGSKDINEFEVQFTNGVFDIAYMNPYHLIVANQNQGYIPLVRDVGRQLYGVIVAKKDSPINDIGDLAGKKVAFPSPNALGAALIPRAEFENNFNIQVEPIYVKSHSSVYLNVVLGKVSAGGGVQKTLNQQPENIKNKLKIIYKTTKVSPHPIAVHPRLTEVSRQKLVEAILQMSETENGKKLLENIPIKKAGIAVMEDYHSLRNMGLEKFYIK